MILPSSTLAIDMSVGLAWKLRSKKAWDSRRLASLWRNASCTRANSSAEAEEDFFLRVATVEHGGASTGIKGKRLCATADLPALADSPIWAGKAGSASRRKTWGEALGDGAGIPVPGLTSRKI